MAHTVFGPQHMDANYRTAQVRNHGVRTVALLCTLPRRRAISLDESQSPPLGCATYDHSSHWPIDVGPNFEIMRKRVPAACRRADLLPTSLRSLSRKLNADYILLFRWSMGSLLFVLAWGFLMGFATYSKPPHALSYASLDSIADSSPLVQHLVSGPRLPFTAAYFGSIGLTLYFSLG